jgi:glycosyltransferase involved in cell wall biosynthesis
MQKRDVLVLIPAWNEARRIGQVIHALPEGMQVLVVDDGSSDGTVGAARAAGAEVISHETNQGKGVALMTGFRWALNRTYPAVITMDADGQHDPLELTKFIDTYTRAGADLIIGRRSTREMPFPRNLANAIGSWILSQVLCVKIFDNQSGYRLHSRAFLEKLVSRRTGFEFEVDVILQALEYGFPIAWVDIRTIYDTSITSHFHPLRDTLKFFEVVWYAFRSRRQRRNARADDAH